MPSDALDAEKSETHLIASHKTNEFQAAPDGNDYARYEFEFGRSRCERADFSGA